MIKQIQTPHKGLNHAGGIQSVAGAFAIVPFEGKKKKGKVVAYDLRPVLKKKTANPKPIELDVDLYGNGAGSAGITHVPDGKGGYYYILGVGAAKTFSFYISNSVSFTDPACKFERLFKHKFKNQLFEAINLFTQADGRVFMIGMQSTTITIPKKIGAIPIPVIGGKEIGAKDDYMRIFEIDLTNNTLVDLKKERHLTVRHTSGKLSNAGSILPVDPSAALPIAAGIASHFRFGSSLRIQTTGKFELDVGQRNFDRNGSYFYNRFR